MVYYVVSTPIRQWWTINTIELTFSRCKTKIGKDITYYFDFVDTTAWCLNNRIVIADLHIMPVLCRARRNVCYRARIFQSRVPGPRRRACRVDVSLGRYNITTIIIIRIRERPAASAAIHHAPSVSIGSRENHRPTSAAARHQKNTQRRLQISLSDRWNNKTTRRRGHCYQVFVRSRVPAPREIRALHKSVICRVCVSVTHGRRVYTDVLFRVRVRIVHTRPDRACIPYEIT